MPFLCCHLWYVSIFSIIEWLEYLGVVLPHLPLHSQKCSLKTKKHNSRLWDCTRKQYKSCVIKSKGKRCHALLDCTRCAACFTTNKTFLKTLSLLYTMYRLLLMQNLIIVLQYFDNILSLIWLCSSHKPTFYSCLNVKELLLEADAKFEV